MNEKSKPVTADAIPSVFLSSFLVVVMNAHDSPIT